MGNQVAQFGVKFGNDRIMGIKLPAPIPFLGNVGGFPRQTREEIFAITRWDIVLGRPLNDLMEFLFAC
jgi:hypothetical protein